MSTAEQRGSVPPAELWSPLATHFGLEPSTIYLNHGSFGATPLAVQEVQHEFRARMEAEATRFIVEELEGLLDDARAEAAAFIGCNPDDMAFVFNATAGVNTVVRSLEFGPGDELLTNTHEYNACNNVLEYAAARAGAKVVRAEIPFPIQSEDEAVAAILERITPRTKLAMISHITSPSALVLPIQRLVQELESRGVDTLVDTAHGPGMVPLDVDQLGAAYCTGNFHKWVCSPKGSAFLHVRRDRQQRIRPLIMSHGANSPRQDRPRFRLEMDYIGSIDYSPWLATPAAIRFMSELFPGGWEELRQRNRELALWARNRLCERLGVPPSAPDSLTGSMAAVRLPDRTEAEQAQPTRYADPLHDRLVHRHRIQVPIIPFPAPPARYVRISAQVYNSRAQYQRLCDALEVELAGGE